MWLWLTKSGAAANRRRAKGYRIRALLNAGMPNCDLRARVKPR